MGFAVFGKYVYDYGLTNKNAITIETLAGLKKLKLNVKNNKVDTVCVDMGEPILEPKKIPVISDEEIVKNLNISLFDENFKFTCVSTGNPHAITFIDNVKEFNIEKYGPKMEVDAHFPNKSNIEFIQVVNREKIKMRVWERGSGETLACGTGACASVVACVLNNMTNRNVIVELLGGNLQIEWREEDNHVYMTGTATTVFEGELESI